MLYVSCFEIGFSVADFWCDYLVKGKLNARGFKSLQSLHKDRLLLRSVMLLPVDLASRDADLLSASLLRGESKHLTICIRIACFEHAYVVIWGCLAKGFRSLEDNYRHSVDHLQPLYQTVSRTFCKLFADMQQVSLFHVFFLWFQIAAQMQQLCISIETCSWDFAAVVWSAVAALYQLFLYLSDMQQLCLCPAVMISDCSTDAAALFQHWNMFLRLCCSSLICCSSFVPLLLC